jgi:hypothetical protein
VITKFSVLLEAPDVAVTPALKVPTFAAVGAREMVVTTEPVPEVGPFSVANAGNEAVRVMGVPALNATTFTVRLVPASRETSEMADTVGAWADAASGARSARPRTRNRRRDFMKPPWGLRVPNRVEPRTARFVDGSRSRVPLDDWAAVERNRRAAYRLVVKTPREGPGSGPCGALDVLFTTGEALEAGHRSGSRHTKRNEE